jgi:RNA polymerase sigma-70 factor (ECF subfamily)
MTMLELIWPAKKAAFNKTLLNDLYRYALSLSHDETLAFDLVQSCCEKTLNKKITPDQHKAFMFKVIRNQYIDIYRRRKLELVIDSELTSQSDIEEQCTLQNLDQIMIDKQHVDLILSDLNYQDRELLYLWAVEGTTMQELSERTATPRGTLLSRLNRLKKRLQQRYGYINEQASSYER